MPTLPRVCVRMAMADGVAIGEDLRRSLAACDRDGSMGDRRSKERANVALIEMISQTALLIRNKNYIHHTTCKQL